MIPRMGSEEIRDAAKLYEGDQLTLAQVRSRLVALGYPSRSVNTIRDRLRENGVVMRRPGRRGASI